MMPTLEALCLVRVHKFPLNEFLKKNCRPNLSILSFSIYGNNMHFMLTSLLFPSFYWHPTDLLVQYRMTRPLAHLIAVVLEIQIKNRLCSYS